jgi:hypothetical protein
MAVSFPGQTLSKLTYVSNRAFFPTSTYLYNKQVLVGEHLLIRDFRPYVIIFLNVCVCVENRCHGNAVWAL